MFVALPTPHADKIADEIPKRPGFGSVRVSVTLGSSKWMTSLFPSNDLETYVLPVKRSVRLKENVATGDHAEFTVRIAPEK